MYIYKRLLSAFNMFLQCFTANFIDFANLSSLLRWRKVAALENLTGFTCHNWNQNVLLLSL